MHVTKALLVLLSATAARAQALKPVDFQREIRPILSDNCFQCHGPDSKTRLADLRLDVKDAALEARKNGAAIVPGKAQSSLLYQRVTDASAARRMPPEYSHKKLTPQQIATFKTWIDQGAPWKEHWAFQPPLKPKSPAVRNAAWPRNPIDAFILAKLEEHNLAPAPRADKRTLIRRVALDLTGLPPKPAEIELFLKDASAQAYEHMVDRYLESPHYGEHRARYWLDAARYGDTHGIHIDNYREIWPYRDWVIAAYNRNLSFKQFTIEQLAGDLLPNPTLDQRIATGFHRCNVTTNEGGVIEDEYAEIYAKDRADTTGAVFLGLTVGCATCHDHKFDPISQKDFYSLGAFFRNTTQKVMDGNIWFTPPNIVVPRQEDRPLWDTTNSKLAATRAEMAKAREGPQPAFEQWLASRKPVEERVIATSDETWILDAEALPKGEGYTLRDAEYAAQKAVGFTKNGGATIKFNDKAKVKMEAEQPFSLSIGFFYPQAAPGGIVVAQDNADKTRGWYFDITNRQPGFRVVADSGRAIEIRSSRYEQLKPNSWNDVVVTYDGTRSAASLTMFVNGKALESTGRAPSADQIGGFTFDQPLSIGRTFNGGAIADLRAFPRVVTDSEVTLLRQWPKIQAELRKQDADRKTLLKYFLAIRSDAYHALMAAESENSAAIRDITRRGSITLVMEENNDSTPFANVLYRGQYDQKRDKVDAKTPTALPPMSSDQPRNRLGFANWLFGAEHPLTGRVAVNRMWLEIFGTGLVKTADDFGSQGEPPSHPQLLDWLATDFRDNGWDMRRFYKQLVMSATYQQSAQLTPVKIAKDPENRFLSRGPRFRLDAELVRDYALASSGLLDARIGGPSVKPYQPDGVWESVAMRESDTRFYKRDAGDSLYRRSMYTFWKRSAPPAAMEIFNAPSRESCAIRRERTNTPLQALVTMNDVQYVEAARYLAGRAMEAAADFDQRLDFVTTRLIARALDPAERRIAKTSFDNFAKYYGAHADEARKLLAHGERKPDPGLPAAEYAALTMLTNEMMNLDEVLNK